MPRTRTVYRKGVYGRSKAQARTHFRNWLKFTHKPKSKITIVKVTQQRDKSGFNVHFIRSRKK